MILGLKQIAWQTFLRTQNLKVRDQLKHGIRYLDARLEIDDNGDDIFLTHDDVDSWDPDPSGLEDKRLYLTKEEDAYSKSTSYTFLDPQRKKYNNNNNYDDDDETKEQKIPILGKAHGKIVLLTCENYFYDDNQQLGITVEVGKKKDIGRCREYAKIKGVTNDARIDLHDYDTIVTDPICDSSITTSAYYVKMELSSFVNNAKGKNENN
ncbi:hypothetical protein H8356DRAFT_1281986 [Neocallimastix lanati (nom. inval.)]|uniref:PLC-like phosphodiesterase n=1 Tax=Neocallimastix californiae TaxID=1754190 RepID=A0A1Y2CKI9_9FUNG|nr:hypothetical protein H8356DRAFT_1281986 [Neocallimastix sp. JGI-2020a]ORY47533.1 hypothetical protein LY90DRAFT_509026 [Neocallimastix californiae]|eukprot:ORY47533.1 hypothetical protein LY90DRAFT_509026 [Neocallimastix californiae]